MVTLLEKLGLASAGATRAAPAAPAAVGGRAWESRSTVAQTYKLFFLHSNLWASQKVFGLFSKEENISCAADYQPLIMKVPTRNQQVPLVPS